LSLRNHDWRDWRDVVNVLARYGFAIETQRAIHVQLKHIDGRLVTIPKHDRIKKWTLRAILEETGVSRQEFLNEL
jgi:predicted RNA binding protein YcfA (HicA-like mRNA interferase family)